MKSCSVLLLFLMLSNLSYAQKKLIDTSAYKIWPSLSGPIVTTNGKFCAYNIRNRPIGGHTLVIQATDGNWKRHFEYRFDANTVRAKFTPNSKYALFINSQGSLSILHLGSSKIDYIPNVKSFNCPSIGDGDCIIYETNHPGEMVLFDISTDTKRAFSNIKRHIMYKNGKYLVLHYDSCNVSQKLFCLNLITGKMNEIWEGIVLKDLTLDEKHHQLAFISTNKNSKSEMETSTLCYYRDNNLSMLPFNKIEDRLPSKNLMIESIDAFSSDGKGLYLNLKRVQEKSIYPNPETVQVDVWSYLDRTLIIEQQLEKGNKSHLAILNLENHVIFQLEQENERCIQRGRGFVILSRETKTLELDTALHPDDPKPQYILVNTRTNKREKIPADVSISPDSRNLVYYDRIQNTFVIHKLQTTRETKLTNGPLANWHNIELNGKATEIRGIAAWLEDNDGLLIYDKYDIWKIDLTGRSLPINLTNGLGAKHEIIFNLLNHSLMKPVSKNNSQIILTGFNKRSKENGFYSLNLAKPGDIQLLSIGPYIYYVPGNPAIPWGSGFEPIKATSAKMYIVRRESTKDFPNYFSTKDFENFNQLSHLNPQKEYNWYSSELHHWMSLDGRPLEGILYKPENFDSTKDYPVIFHYYEKKADGLYAYLSPAVSNGSINIPTFVSNGYLVFTPDIHYMFGDPMQGTYDAVVSAAKYVNTLPFVDKDKIGIQGWSFGGWETNYLVAHTNIFAAAAESAGASNIISKYGSIVRNGRTNHKYYEIGQGRMKGTLWDKPKMYIKNSPIFSIDKVTTPLLMMHNKGDQAVPFEQAIELFTGLRRLGKKVWLLQYHGQGHGVHGKSAIDFTIRLSQFFDHYLKGSVMPIWMSKGIFSKNKAIATGLELDDGSKATNGIPIQDN